MSAPTPDALAQFLRRLASQLGEEPADAELVGRFLASRDEQAFRRLVSRHGPMVWGVCRRVLPDPRDAEDAFQATFVVLARRAEAAAGVGSLPAWLHTVARRSAWKVRELAARRRREVAVGTVPDVPAPGPEPSAELAAVLDDELGRLPESLRAPVVLCYLQGNTYAEAARQLGCSVGTVSKRVAKGFGQLQNRLARRGVAPGVGLLATAGAASAVPPTLLERAVQAGMTATAGALTPSVVAAAADAVGRSVGRTKLSLVGVAVLTAAGAVAAGLGVAVLAAPRPAASEAPPPAKAALALDRNGDPLPAGAVARIGTPRFHTGRYIGIGGVDDVAFLSVGRVVASVHGDGRVRLWNADDGRPTGAIDGPDATTCVAATADGKRLAAAGRVGDLGGPFEVWCWEVGPRGSVLAWRQEIEPEAPPAGAGDRAALARRGRGHPVALAFSPDGATLAGLTYAGRGQLFDAKTGKPGRSLDAPPPPAPGRRVPHMPRVGFAADGKSVVAGHDAAALWAWDVATGTGRPAGAPDPAQVARFRVGPAAGAAAEDTALYLPFLTTGPNPDRGVGSDGPVHLTADRALPAGKTKRLSPDGRRLAVAHWGEVRVWDLTTGKEVGPAAPFGPVIQLTFAPDGKTVATLTRRYELRLWDAATGRPGLVLNPDEKAARVSGVRFTRDGVVETSDFVPFGNPVRRITRRNPETGAAASNGVPGLVPTSSSLCVNSTDGRWVAVVTGEKSVTLQPRGPGEAVTVEPAGSLESLAFAAEAPVLVLTTTAGTVEVWGLDGVSRLRTQLPDRGADDAAPAAPAISPDGRTVAVVIPADGGQVVDLLGVGGRPSRRLPDPRAVVRQLAYSADGRLLAAGTEDGGAIVWDAAAGREVRRFAGHRGAVAAVAFSPDGRRLATGGADGTGLVWDLGRLTSE